MSKDSKTKYKRDENILLILNKLRKSTQVTIDTNKTNSFKAISIEKYKLWVYGHLEKTVKEVKRERITENFEQANQTCDKYQHIIILKTTLKMKNIPTPKLIIKDYKKRRRLRQQANCPR